MSKSPQFKKKQLATVVKNVIDNDGIMVDMEDDESFLKNNPVSWDELNALKDDLASTTMEFVGQIKSIISNPLVMNNLGDRATELSNLTTLFFSDIKDFSSQVATLRAQHENKSGVITTLEDYDTYNRIAINYHNLYMELSTLTSPTMSSIVVLISDVTEALDKQAKEEEANNV